MALARVLLLVLALGCAKGVPAIDFRADELAVPVGTPIASALPADAGTLVAYFEDGTGHVYVAEGERLRLAARLGVVERSTGWLVRLGGSSGRSRSGASKNSTGGDPFRTET